MQRTLQRRKAPNAWWVAIVCGMAAFVDAAATAGVGVALVLAQSHNGSPGLTPNEIGLLTGLLTAGIAVGSLAGGRLADRFGRRPIFLLTMAMVVVGGATPFFGVNVVTLVPGVILIGVGVGADLPAAASTIAEAANNRNRGKMLTLSYILSALGVVMPIIISTKYGSLGATGAQIMFGAFAIVGVVVFLFRLTIPESQIWLAAQAERLQEKEADRTPRVRLRNFGQRPYLRPFVTLVLFYTLTSITISISTTFGTYVAVNVAKIPVGEYQAWTIAVMPAIVLGAVAFSAVVDTRFRLAFFIGGALINVLAPLVPVFFGFSLPTLIGSIIVAGFAGGFCFETIMKVWTQESFPTMLRSTAQGTIYFVGRMGVAGLAVFTPALLALNANLMYVGVSIVGLIGFGIGWWGFRRHVANQFDVETEILPVDEKSLPTPLAAQNA